MDNKEKRPLSSIVIQYSGYIAFLGVVILFTMKAPVFLNPKNISNIFLQSSVLGIVSFGLTGIFIGGGDHVIRGGTDLSITSNMAVSAAIVAVMLNNGYHLLLGIGLALIVSLAIGAINAFAVVKLKMIPLLVTICMMYILQGVEKLITNNKVIPANNAILSFIANEEILFAPIAAWIFVIVALLVYLLYNSCSYGNHVSAIGGNELAARASGINVSLIVASTYLLAGVLAVISGILILARLSSLTPGVGDLMLFDVMLVSYLGAVFSKRFRPNIPGTFFGALFVGVLTNGFTMINVPSYWVYAIKGALILITVSITTMQRRRVL